jgi:hypothetical protein
MNANGGLTGNELTS